MIGWLIPDSLRYRSRVAETPDEDPRDLDYDISVKKLEDDGSVYLFCIDRPADEVRDYADFLTESDIGLPNSHIVVLGGKLGGDVEIVETSVSEVFGHDDD